MPPPPGQQRGGASHFSSLHVFIFSLNLIEPTSIQSQGKRNTRPGQRKRQGKPGQARASQGKPLGRVRSKHASAGARSPATRSPSLVLQAVSSYSIINGPYHRIIIPANRVNGRINTRHQHIFTSLLSAPGATDLQARLLGGQRRHRGISR